MSMELQLIDTIFFSDKRKNLLLLLKDGPKTIEEIKTELEVSSSPIMAQIRILLKGRAAGAKKRYLRALGKREAYCPQNGASSLNFSGFR